MSTKYTLHKSPKGFIVTSDEEITKNDLMYNIHEGINSANGKSLSKLKGSKKVIVQQDKIDFSALTKKQQEEIRFFDIDNLAKETVVKYVNEREKQTAYLEYISGFQKAQELLSDKMFTLEDMREAYNQGMKNQSIALQGLTYDRNFEVLTDELQHKSWEVEIEMETKCYCGHTSFCDCGQIDDKQFQQRPKLTNGKIRILKIL